MAIDLYMGVRFTAITCCRQGCGIVFAVPDWWQQKRMQDQSEFFCPNGHGNYYPGETDADRVKKLKDQLNRERAQADQEKAYLRERAERLERSRAAMKGQVTRIRTRIGKGVCPCCNRTFADLARHMAGQHPTWRPEDSDLPEPPAHLNARDRKAWLAGAEAEANEPNPYKARGRGISLNRAWRAGHEAALASTE